MEVYVPINSMPHYPLLDVTHGNTREIDLNFLPEIGLFDISV